MRGCGHLAAELKEILPIVGFSYERLYAPMPGSKDTKDDASSGT